MPAVDSKKPPDRRRRRPRRVPPRRRAGRDAEGVARRGAAGAGGRRRARTRSRASSRTATSTSTRTRAARCTTASRRSRRRRPRPSRRRRARSSPTAARSRRRSTTRRPAAAPRRARTSSGSSCPTCSRATIRGTRSRRTTAGRHARSPQRRWPRPSGSRLRSSTSIVVPTAVRPPRLRHARQEDRRDASCSRAADVRARLGLRSTAFRIGVLRVGRPPAAATAGAPVVVSGLARDVDGAAAREARRDRRLAAVGQGRARRATARSQSPCGRRSTATYRLTADGQAGPALTITVPAGQAK